MKALSQTLGEALWTAGVLRVKKFGLGFCENGRFSLWRTLKILFFVLLYLVGTGLIVFSNIILFLTGANRSKKKSQKSSQNEASSTNTSEVSTESSEKKKTDYVSPFKHKIHLEKGEWKGSESDYVVLDTETTGFQGFDEVIQLAIVDLTGKVLFNQNFCPKVKVNPEAFKVNHLSNEILAGEPKWREKWPEIQQILAGKTILMHNSGFDTRLINQTCKRYKVKPRANFKYACTMKYFDKACGKKGLAKVVQYYQLPIDLNQLHDAAADCHAVIKALEASLNA